MIIRILVIVGMLVEQYKTEQEAIDRYIETETITGTLIQFNLSDDKKILLAEYKSWCYIGLQNLGWQSAR
ncbi:hypothetical protein ACFW1P_13525 [Paenibacillus sp. NPDC058910]|uniref:hypothetical protein n=1 Tax=unclassified Paenibacillus TaxID=185978 RepID=UPI0036CFC227